MIRKTLFTSMLTMFLLIIVGCSEKNATDPSMNSDINLAGVTSAFPLAESEDPPIGFPAGPICIQEGPGPFLFQALDLTDEQTAQLKEIALSYREKLEDLWLDIRQSGLSRQAAHEKHMALRQEMYEEMRSVLTEEQKATLAEIEAQLAQGVYPEILIEKRIARLTEVLNLEEAQQQALKQIFADYGARILALRTSNEDMRTIHTETKKIMDELHQAVIGVLNDDQIALYDALIEQHHRQAREHMPHHGRGGHNFPH